jgi:hypothetical protein
MKIHRQVCIEIQNKIVITSISYGCFFGTLRMLQVDGRQSKQRAVRIILIDLVIDKQYNTIYLHGEYVCSMIISSEKSLLLNWRVWIPIGIPCSLTLIRILSNRFSSFSFFSFFFSYYIFLPRVPVVCVNTSTTLL